jgi:hypothetical protein
VSLFQDTPENKTHYIFNLITAKQSQPFLTLYIPCKTKVMRISRQPFPVKMRDQKQLENVESFKY